MLPQKILKILLLRLARIAFVASFPPIFFKKSLLFKIFWNNSKFREKFNFSGSSVRKTIFRESHRSSGRKGNGQNYPKSLFLDAFINIEVCFFYKLAPNIHYS